MYFPALAPVPGHVLLSLSTSVLIGKSNYFVVILMLVLFHNQLQKALRRPTDRTTHTYTIRDLNKIKRFDGKSVLQEITFSLGFGGDNILNLLIHLPVNC